MFFFISPNYGAIFSLGWVNANPAKFDVVSKFRITKGSGPYWAHMHINKGILYVRHGELLAAYKL